MAYITSRPTALAHGATLSRLALATLCAGFATPLQAFEASDPFAIRALTPARPALTISGELHRMPCQALPADAVYGMLEVVDLALCKNPTTREAWSYARVQAAQVGLAQSDFLPTVDGQVAASRIRADSRSTTQRNASLRCVYKSLIF